jgi:hypothetical protein
VVRMPVIMEYAMTPTKSATTKMVRG